MMPDAMPGAYAHASVLGNARTDGRTDGLTQMACHLRDETSPSVTRTPAYGNFPQTETLRQEATR